MNTGATASAYYAGTRPELRPFIPPHRRVLEIGCGRGGFRANLDTEAEVWGIEMISEAAAEARAVLHRVVIGRFSDVAGELPRHYFDLVICNDVIEHMPDDEQFLRTLHDYLAPGARLMGSIPNIRYWPVLRQLVFAKEWHYQDEGVLDRTHLRSYTVKSFPRLLRETGYEVLRFEGINRGVRGWRRRALQILLPGWSADVFYVQFAFVARPLGEP